jgi:putative ABC transport system substrate-binding protein
MHTQIADMDAVADAHLRPRKDPSHPFPRARSRVARPAAELVGLKVDVIVTESNVAALTAKRATATIPTVMAIAGDPVKAGVVGGLARPGGNVTGLTLIHRELSGKRLQLLKETVPEVASVAVVWNPADPAAVDFLRDTEAAARGIFLDNRARIVRFAMTHRPPGIFPPRAFVDADLPIEQPTKFGLVINLKTAKAAGLAIPPSMLARADHLIE